MAATVYNGVLQGTGATHIQTLYTNNTGKNVRIVWNYIKAGNSQASSVEMIIGPITTLPDHSNGNNLDTILIALSSGFRAGKNLGVFRNDDNTAHRASGGTSGSFPTELMLPDGDKLSVRIPSQITSYVNALHYNFVAITED